MDWMVILRGNGEDSWRRNELGCSTQRKLNVGIERKSRADYQKAENASKDTEKRCHRWFVEIKRDGFREENRKG